jgi:hypothetical protein
MSFVLWECALVKIKPGVTVSPRGNGKSRAEKSDFKRLALQKLVEVGIPAILTVKKSTTLRVRSLRALTQDS